MTFRLTKWDINGDFQYELYDHKFDEEELNNLSIRFELQFNL